MLINESETRNNIFEKFCNNLKLSEKDWDKIRSETNSYLDENNWVALNFLYQGEPKPQPRARTGSSGFFYDPGKGLKLWLVEQLKGQLPKDFTPIESEVNFEVSFYRQMPKTSTKKDKVLMEMGIKKPVGRPDIDNYVKLVQDALNKVFYADDSVISCLKAEKYFSSFPRVEIRITYRK